MVQPSRAVIGYILLLSCVAALVTRCVAIALYCNLWLNDGISPAWIGITGTDIYILLQDFIDPLIVRLPLGKIPYFSRLVKSRFCRRAYSLLFVMRNIFLFVSTIFLVVWNATSILAYNEMSTMKIVMISFEATSAAFTIVYFSAFIASRSLGFAMAGQVVVVMVSMLEIVLAMISAWINSLERIAPDAISRVEYQYGDSLVRLVKMLKAFQYFNLLLASTGTIGLLLAVSINASNRLALLPVRLVYVYSIACFACIIVYLVYFGMSIRNVEKLNDLDVDFKDVKVANPIIAVAALILCVVGLTTAYFMSRRPQSTLAVEEIDLDKFSVDQKKILAKLIDNYNRALVPGNASGENMLSLMDAYVQSPMPSLHCKVLRIYDDGNTGSGNFLTASPSASASASMQRDPERDHDEIHKGGGGLHIVKSYLSFASSIETEARKKYERVRAFDMLDLPLIFEDLPLEFSNVPVRKSKAKKASSHPKAAFIDKYLPNTPDDDPFKQFIMTTEAMVLLSVIDDHDLSSSLPPESRLGRFASKYLGAKSRFKLLAVRIGLLASHFPFRQAIVYTSPTKKPIARAAAVCMTISHWNRRLPRNQRCDLLLDPAFAHSGMGEEFEPSGWVTSGLPPTHVIDLRPYAHCKTVKEYLKAIKYRDQSATFVREGGQVIETTDFSPENCRIAIDLWAKIAAKRTGEGHTAVLSPPTPEFLQSLGSKANEKGFRSLLFLKIDGEAIASCVLFRLGDTITSDIQGLDHTIARRYKAYFVMMQETINIALRENVKFVDFGPTTGKAKLDIGAQEVTLIGGLWARQPLKALSATFAESVE